MALDPRLRVASRRGPLRRGRGGKGDGETKLAEGLRWRSGEPAAIGVDGEVARRAQGSFANAWQDATYVKRAVESLAECRDPEGAVFDTMFFLHHFDDSMPWLMIHTALAYREVYGGRWRSRQDQIDFVLESFRSGWDLDGIEQLARAIIDARVRARSTAELLSELGLTGLEMDMTPRGALTKIRKQLDALDASSNALREAIAATHPRAKRTASRPNERG